MDVEGMRDTMTPHQAAKWEAFRVIQPDAQERMCDILKLGLCAIANSMGAEHKPDDFEPCEDKKHPEPVAGPAQAAAIVASNLGKPDVNSNR